MKLLQRKVQDYQSQVFTLESVIKNFEQQECRSQKTRTNLEYKLAILEMEKSEFIKGNGNFTSIQR